MTKYAAWRSVSPEMSSTSFVNLGSDGTAGDGVDDEASAAAVASVRERKAKAWGLQVWTMVSNTS